MGARHIRTEMPSRRTMFLLGWALLGLAAIAGTAERSNVSTFAVFVIAAALAILAFVAFALLLRPRIIRQSPKPASQNRTLGLIAVLAVLSGTFLAEVLTGWGAIAVVGIGYGAIFGLLMWTPTLASR